MGSGESRSWIGTSITETAPRPSSTAIRPSWAEAHPGVWCGVVAGWPHERVRVAHIARHHIRGEGSGSGANLNVPLPPGSGDEAYQSTLARVVIPAIEAFQPDLILVACGFDANVFDPMGRMLLHSDSYRSLTRRLLDTCDRRLVMVHEGGYSEFYVPFCGLAVVEELAGERTEVVDPYLDEARRMAGHSLISAQIEVIDAAAQLVRTIP
jgi:hypothetical protein